MSFTKTQIENIQIDHGIVYKDYGEVTEELIGPTKGGATFDVTKVIREIEFDGSKGKTKGAQVVETIDAMLSIASLNSSMDVVALALPFATYADSIVTAEDANVGIIDDSAYQTNITMFAKLISGEYKKITLYNAMSESDFSLAAIPKGEGIIALEINAHWNITDDTVDLFKIEDVASIDGDTTPPTLTTVPIDAATGIVVSDVLTATFDKAIKSADINTDNFILVSALGDVVVGAIAYNSSTKVATFTPTTSLDASTVYIWTISNVHDLAGNKLVQVAINFTTAA